MNQTKIILNDQEYILKQSFRGLMIFEKMTGKNAYQANTSMNDSLTMFYAMLQASNRTTFTMSFDEFLDQLDEFPEALSEYNSYLVSLYAESSEDIETAVADKKKVETR